MTQTPGGYGPSATEVAKQEAGDVARTAAQRGGEVGGTAGEQAKRVASETARQARDLMDEGRTQLVEQARNGQQKAAGSLHTIADQLHDMSERSDGEGVAPEIVRQASERARGVATWLDEREPGALLDEVRAFARRRPGPFLAAAVVAGVLAGRLTRAAASGGSSEPDSGPRHAAGTRAPADTPPPNPAPTSPPGGYAAPSGSVPVPPPVPTGTPGGVPGAAPTPWTDAPDPYRGPVTP